MVFARSAAGIVTLELVVAIALLAGAMLPFAYAFLQEHRLARAYYYRAVAMAIVDGEMEILGAGEWRAFNQGRQPYPVRAESARNLPAGEFILALDKERIRLEWRPAGRNGGGTVWREAQLGETPDQTGESR